MSALEALGPAFPPLAGEEAVQRPLLEVVGLTKRFGAFTALDDVSLRLAPGSFHALLGENGAGKSTLVKCMLGYYRPDAGSVLLDDREVEVASPRDARRLGIGMVYQHFTLVPAMTVLENLVMAGARVPALIDWRRERARLAAFIADMPLKVPLDSPVHRLSAGERQKTEILKELYLGSRVLVLDEPTSVLTPGEARDVLQFLRERATAQGMGILLITHKFAEVTAFCDEVSVLRKGRLVGGGRVGELSPARMAEMMIGARDLTSAPVPTPARGDAPTVLKISGLKAGSGRQAIDIDGLEVRAGEIVGVAGISGNGQAILVETLSGQTSAFSGSLHIHGKPYGASRAEAKAARVRVLPEEPLRNACVGRMSLAENLAFRSFDVAPGGARRRLLDKGEMRRRAVSLIEAYSIKAQSPEAPIESLSGGNVQRAVLARELDGEADLLIVANPCFGLDFGAVADIRAAIVAARNRGAAVLLVSEDLDEIVALSDRILVMLAGRIVFESPGGKAADPMLIGRHMAGHS